MPNEQDHGITKWQYFLLFLSILLNLSGLFIPIIGPDGTLYASIAKTMVQHHNFIGLYAEGRDWLDKPHFPFWITAFSFELFGFHTWAYKLPAIIFLLAGSFYTYRFAKEFYNTKIAVWSAIILLTAEHIIISNNDVRAEAYLTGLVIASTFHFYKSYSQKSANHLVAGAAFAAAAVMTKGLLALIPIGGAISGGLIVTSKKDDLLHARWLLAGLLILLFITPELICLWYQFDLHPEKTIFGRTHESGLRFFFWDSQFGRFMNTAPIKGKGNPWFFVHTILWAFLPWSLLMYAAIAWRIRKSRKLKVGNSEWFTISGALLTFLVFSLSKFQLPHYTNIIFPFLSILTVNYIFSVSSSKTINRIKKVQVAVIVLLLLALVLIQLFFKPATWAWALLFFLFIIIACFRIYRDTKTKLIEKMVIATAFTAIGLNFFLNLVFYPSLLSYQSGSEVAFYLNKNYPGQPVLQLTQKYPCALEFYLHAPMLTFDKDELQKQLLSGVHFVYFAKDDAKFIPVPYQFVRSFKDFPISRLTGKFINSKTRSGEVKEYWLVKI